MRFRKKRGQVAVEFLTTYGWALMAIVVAVGALYYFDFLSPDRYVSQYCETGGQIECLEAILEDNGALRFNFRNNFNVDIDINSILVFTPQGEFDLKIDNGISTISRGESEIIGFERLAEQQAGRNRNLDIQINFSRVGSSYTYILRGTALLGVVEGNCGNEEINVGEQCEGTDVGGVTCGNFSLASGPVLCSPSCTFDLSMCS